jgi:hypothetical protein
MPISIDESLKDFLVIWAAGLSTLLGALKLLDYWDGRFRLQVDYDFTDDPSEGNKITLRNLTSNPITISYKELLIRRSWRFFQKYEEVPLTDEQPYDVCIPAHSSHTFNYKDMSHFSLNSKLLTGKTIYLKIWIAGRRPLTLVVYRNGT